MKKTCLIILSIVFLSILSACSTTLSVDAVHTLEPIETTQFSSFGTELPAEVEVTLSDGTTQNLSITWAQQLSTININAHGTFTITGHIDDTQYLFEQTNQITQTLLIHPATILEALIAFEDHQLFLQLYQAFESEHSIEIRTWMIPSDEAIEDLLHFMELSLEAFIEHPAFEAFMKDHLFTETISANRLENTVPSVYQTLSSYELIVEGTPGNPLINQRIPLKDSFSIDNGHVHLLDGVILSDNSLRSIGLDILDDSLSQRFMDLLTQSGLIWDIVFGRQITVFVPTERALFDFAEANHFTLSELVNWEGLEDLLLNHIIRDQYSLESLFLQAPMELTAMNQSVLNVELMNSALYVQGHKVLSTESIGGVGYLHMIDGVIEISNQE